MQVVGVRHVNFQKVTFVWVLYQLTYVTLKLIWVAAPFIPTSQKVLAHGPTVKIVSIQLLKVMTLLNRIELFIHILIVRLHVSTKCLSNTALCASLKHQQHIRFS